ncbi:MAG: hypothetical protein EZS28_042767, partial [Streblomastix strix]
KIFVELVTHRFIADYVFHLAQGKLTSFAAHGLTQWGPDRSKMNESQGFDKQTSTQTELLAKKGIDYAIIMIVITCKRVKLLLQAEIQAVRREDPENLFIKKEKRSRDMEDIKPVQSQKSARDEDGEHIQKTVIDLEQGDGDEGWDEPFQGFPERLNEPRRHQSSKLYLGLDWKIIEPNGKTKLKQGDQYADEMTELIDEQQTLIVAMEIGLGGNINIESIEHTYALLCVGAKAVALLNELNNAPRELKGVVGDSILPADIFSDDSIESIKSLKSSNHSCCNICTNRQPFQLFQPFEIQQTLYAASLFNYGGVAAAGRGLQPCGRGGRGRRAFGFDFLPFEGQ